MEIITFQDHTSTHTASHSEMLIVNNDGVYISDTNYFGSTKAQKGLLFISINAGAYRLLIPESQEHTIPDMLKSLKYIAITYAPKATGWLNSLSNSGKRFGSGYEILFEDNSDTPFVINIQTAQCDRTWVPKSRNGKPVKFLIYTSRGLHSEHLAYERKSNKIPCLKPVNRKA